MHTFAQIVTNIICIGNYLALAYLLIAGHFHKQSPKWQRRLYQIFCWEALVISVAFIVVAIYHSFTGKLNIIELIQAGLLLPFLLFGGLPDFAEELPHYRWLQPFLRFNTGWWKGIATIFGVIFIFLCWRYH